jgi:hypothetical protein
VTTVAALYVDPKGVYANLPDVEVWDEARDARKYAGPHPVVAHPPCARWCRLAGLVQKRWGYKKGDDGGTFAAALEAVRTFGGVLEHPAYSDAFKTHGIAPPVGGGWQRTLCGGWVCHVEQWHYGHKAKKATWLYAFGIDPPSMNWGRTPDNAAPAYVTDGGGDVKRHRSERCICPLKCDCQSPDTNPAMVSNACPEHNLYPLPVKECPAKEHGPSRGRPALVECWSSRPRALVSWCGNHVKDGENRERLGKKAAAATPLPFRDLLLSIARSTRGSR